MKITIKSDPMSWVYHTGREIHIRPAENGRDFVALKVFAMDTDGKIYGDDLRMKGKHVEITLEPGEDEDL